MPAARILVLLALAILMLPIVLPVLMVAVGSLWSGSFIRLPGEFTINNYTRFLTSARSFELMSTTLQITLGTAAIAVTVGGLLAWIVARTNIPFRPIVRWLPVAPMLLSGLVANIGWIILYSPTAGLVNLWLKSTFGLTEPVFNIFSMLGLVTSLGLHIVPIPYLILLGPLESMNRSLDEASRASGAKQLRTLRYVTLPLLMPALLSSLTLSAIIASHAFETPLMIGLPAGIVTYVSSIYEAMVAGRSYSFASAQAMIYLAFIGLLLFWNRRMTRVEARFSLVAGKGHNRGTVDFGPWRWAMLAIVLFVFVISSVQLVAANVLVSLLPFYSTSQALPPMSLDNYGEAFATPRSLEAIRNSLVLGAEVAVACVFAATFLAFIAYKTRLPGRRLAEETGTLPVAFPPVVLSMALLITLLSIPGMVVMYNTVALLVLVLAVVFLPFAIRVIGSTLISIDNQLLEASASSGAGTLRTVRSIVLPLMATPMTSAAAIVFIFSFRELGGIALVTPPGMALLPTQIYTLWQTGFLRNVYSLNVISFTLTVLALIAAGVLISMLSRGVLPARSGEREPAIASALAGDLTAARAREGGAT